MSQCRAQAKPMPSTGHCQCRVAETRKFEPLELIPPGTYTLQQFNALRTCEIARMEPPLFSYVYKLATMHCNHFSTLLESRKRCPSFAPSPPRQSTLYYLCALTMNMNPSGDISSDKDISDASSESDYSSKPDLEMSLSDMERWKQLFESKTSSMKGMCRIFSPLTLPVILSS